MGTAYEATALATEVGIRAGEAFPDLVTFSRVSNSKGTAGGNISSSANTSPASVPCRYRPSTGSEIEQTGKAISGTVYTIFIPAYFSSALIDVDSKCQAVVAARSGGEPSRTFNVQWIGRFEGVVIHVICTVEE